MFCYPIGDIPAGTHFPGSYIKASFPRPLSIIPSRPRSTFITNMSSHFQAKPRWDAWPPTQVRLTPSTPKDYPSLDDINEDPLNYFLTPPTDFEDASGDIDMFDFDAGIESPHSSHDIVRSVSPSSLEGLSKPGSPPVPDLSDLATPDTDDEEESYMRFAPHHFGLPSTLRDFMMDSERSKQSQVSNSPSSPLDAPRGRSRGSRPVGRGRQPSFATRRRSQQVWREPSPDVWSIEEETEEAMSELGSTVAADSDAGEVLASAMKKDRTRPVDIQAAKPTKKVRFVLPAEEI
ncbi:hypothetical protein EV126DRAFT_431433 [Verticillium dahliae]|nr:hypothetical protein EV126DRAFT_435035 [Verticillium dahliae]KAH6689312.1 hypothetical protein EV126DRAFT_431433 [Verticillium dahliae]